jgi:hypothetical protein
LRALDLRREDGLLADIHIEKQVLARQQHGDAVEPAEGTLRDGQPVEKAEEVERRIRRKRGRDEGAHHLAPDRGFDVAAEAGTHRGGGGHAAMVPRGR